MVCITLSLSIGGSVGTRGRGPPVERTLQGVGAFPGLGAQCPGDPADSGGGARLSLKKVGGKNTRAPPWTRVFMAARSHSLGLGLVVFGAVEGLFPTVC